MCKTVQRRNPGWRNVLIKGDSIQTALNLDVLSDNCIRWKYKQQNNQSYSDLDSIASSENSLNMAMDDPDQLVNAEENAAVNERPTLDLHVPADNHLHQNRVYRLPLATDAPTFENLRVTVNFPENVPSITSRFNRFDPHRSNNLKRSRQARSRVDLDEG